MRRIRGWLGPAALVLLAIVLSELPGVKQAGQTIDDYREPLLAATIGLAALGFAVFMGGVLSMLMASGTAMTHEEIESAISQRRGAGQPFTFRASAHRVFGTAEGQQATNEASFAGVKDAWRTSEWRRDTHWRRFFVIGTGAVMLFYGIFGIILVVGPTHIKVLVAGVMAYGTAMSVWGFARA
jgi:hypothetical protein